ncbi:MAG: NADPH-dependent FMN reductase [Bacteroidota bacterium]
MAKILCISGSVRPESSNQRLLDCLGSVFPAYNWVYFDLSELPPFLPTVDRAPWPPAVDAWRQEVADCDAVLLTTPEYLHNLPALVKNALEWLTTSGELQQKPVLPITFTPHPPRGERAMQSLLWSLQALEARVVVQLPLYQNEIVEDQGVYRLGNELEEIIAESLKLLVG